MNSILTFQYPIWFIAFCILLGAVYAGVLYFRDNTFKDATVSQQKWLYGLAFFRFFAATFLAVLLLSPFIKSRFTDVQKPYIVVLQDVSESVGKAWAEGDSLAYRQNIDQLVNSFGEDYEIATYSFGDDLQTGLDHPYSEKITNLSNVLTKVQNEYSGQNVGAMILASDGIFNQGSNPIYNDIKINAPIYTIALGDTTPKMDVKVEKVLHNRIAYLGDKFMIRIDVSAYNCLGKGATLSVHKQGGGKVFSKSLKLDEFRYFASEEVVLEADKPGVQKYSIRVSSLEGEITVDNNYKSIYIDVIEGKQKILLLANSPHPDIAALKQSIEGSRNYQVEMALMKDFDGKVGDFDLAVMHGLPSRKHDITALSKELKNKNIPAWYIVSSQTQVSQLSSIQDIVKIQGGTTATNEVKPNLNSSFGLFTFDKEALQALNEFPPLFCPYGTYELSPTAQTLMKQQIGTVGTDYPLFAFHQSSAYKSAILCGEGFWRWRMYDYLGDKDQEVIDELVSKTIQYLAVKNDKRQFRVYADNNIFNESEAIVFDGELYNDSYELVNEPDVSLSIVSEAEQEYQFTFSRTASAYTLNAGVLPVGDYTFRAKTNFSGKDFRSNGSFTIRPIELEALQTTADHQLLQALSEKYGGEMIYVDQMVNLTEKVSQRAEIKPVLYSTYKTQSVINLKWIFFVLLSLLGVEWFVRKYLGGY